MGLEPHEEGLDFLQGEGLQGDGEGLRVALDQDRPPFPPGYPPDPGELQALHPLVAQEEERRFRDREKPLRALQLGEGALPETGELGFILAHGPILYGIMGAVWRT